MYEEAWYALIFKFQGDAKEYLGREKRRCLASAPIVKVDTLITIVSDLPHPVVGTYTSV